MQSYLAIFQLATEAEEDQSKLTDGMIVICLCVV